MKKLLKSKVYGSVNSARRLGLQLRLVKKKKRKKEKRKTQKERYVDTQTRYPNTPPNGLFQKLG